MSSGRREKRKKKEVLVCFLCLFDLFKKKIKMETFFIYLNIFFLNFGYVWGFFFFSDSQMKNLRFL